MDPEFKHLLIRVVLTGGVMGVLGAAILMFSVRAFREQKRMTSFAGPLLIVVVLAFVMLCCFLLLSVSFPR